MKILTGTSIKKLDEYTIENEPIESLDLMERAAEKLTEAITQRWDNTTPITVFAGPGNNGGDALAVSRMLTEKGYSPEVYLINMTGHLSENCQTNMELLESMERVTFYNITSPFAAPKLTDEHVVIDGLFGSGINKPLTGAYAAVVGFLNASPATIVSIDMPSGLMTEDNSYNNLKNVVHADLTLSIQLPKLAFFFAENEPFVGEWDLLDIDLSEEFIEKEESDFEIQEKDDVADMIRPRSRFSHKGTYGHALLVAGSYGMAGASILAGKACLKSGVGLLSIHAPFCNREILQTTIPEAIIDEDIDERIFAIAPITDNYQAVGVGPGIGTSEDVKKALVEMLADCQVPCVIDADAINILANDHHALTNLPKGSILTPHPKEMDRLVGRCSDSYERLTRAIELAKNIHCHIVLKGAFSIIITPSGKCFFNPTGNNGMATGGCGDVLTGVITALLAQGYDSEDAARLGTFVHGLAGDIACKKIGEIGMTAGDVVKYLPSAWQLLNEN